MDLTPLEEALQTRDYVVVTGASGSGLTTMANQIHDTWPTAAVVGQDPIAHVTFLRETVIEEVAIGLEQHGVARHDMQERCERILDAAGLMALAEHNPAKLSGGQTRRLAIAAVAILEPEILVLDDPFAGLDPVSTTRIQGLLQGLPSKIVVLTSRGQGHFSLIDASLHPPTPQPPITLPTRVSESDLPALDLGDVAATRGGAKRKWWQFRHREEPVFIAGPIHLVSTPGEVLWLRGENGAGKTTLLRALAGLDGNPGLAQTHGVSVSLALQRAADQLVESTVGAFIGHPGTLGRLNELLASVGAAPLDPEAHPLDLPAAHLRLAQLAQVFSQDRQLVLLDEPDVGLDTKGRSAAHALIADALTKGQAVILTCHDESFAAEVGKYCTVHQGNLQC